MYTSILDREFQHPELPHSEVLLELHHWCLTAHHQQGYAWSLLAMDLSPASALKAAGNAYPVPCESTRAAEKAWSKKIAAADEADIDYAGPNGELRCRVEI